MSGPEAPADPDGTGGPDVATPTAATDDPGPHAGSGSQWRAGDAPQHPPGLDAPGKGRFRWRYTLWFTWPRRPPTQQHLRDFVFTTWTTVIGGSAVGVGAVLLAAGMSWGLVAAGVAAGTLLAALLGWPYVAMGRQDWRRRQA